jgi:hypothetical protein
MNGSAHDDQTFAAAAPESSKIIPFPIARQFVTWLQPKPATVIILPVIHIEHIKPFTPPTDTPRGKLKKLRNGRRA